MAFDTNEYISDRLVWALTEPPKYRFISWIIWRLREPRMIDYIDGE